MLKKLKIIDFEAHKNTVLHFGPGLNVIHGRSNNGKSASLRALELPAYGTWAAGENKKDKVNGPIRVGAKFCEIEVESDRGIVKVKRDGKSINEWNISNTETGEELTLQNPGAGAIPQAQDILGLRSIEIGGTQIRFNWSDQRDKHFLIDEIEGKSSSPSIVAGILDEVGGLSGCEDLVRELASDKGAFEKAMKDSAEQALRVDEQLEKFSELDNEISRFSSTEELLNKAEELKNKSIILKTLHEKIKSLKIALSTYKNLEEEIKKIENAEKTLTASNEKAEKVRKQIQILTSYYSVVSKIKEVEVQIEKIEKIDVTTTIEKREKSEKLEKKAEEIRKLDIKIRKLQEQIDNLPEILDFRKAAGIVAITETKIESLDVTLKLQKRIKDKLEDIVAAQTKLNEAQTNKEYTELEFEKIIDELKICPTCGQEITAECKAEIIEGA